MKFNVFNNIDGIPNKIYTDNVSIINIPEVGSKLVRVLVSIIASPTNDPLCSNSFIHQNHLHTMVYLH